MEDDSRIKSESERLKRNLWIYSIILVILIIDFITYMIISRQSDTQIKVAEQQPQLAVHNIKSITIEPQKKPKDLNLDYLLALMEHTAKVQKNAQVIGYTMECISKGEEIEKSTMALTYFLAQQKDLANEGKCLSVTASFKKTQTKYNKAMDDLIYVSDYLLPGIQYGDQERINECVRRTRHAKTTINQAWNMASKEVKRLKSNSKRRK